MIIFISLLFAIIPSILLFKLLYTKYAKEKKTQFVLSFIAGFACIVTTVALAVLFNLIFITRNQWILVIIKSFVYNGLFPELSKLFLFLFLIYKNSKKATDGIILYIIMSFGFVYFENLFYSSGDTGLLRAFTAIPGHILWSGIAGYYITKVRKPDKKRLLISGLFMAAIYHGTFNFLLFTGTNKIIGNVYLKYLVIPLLILCFMHFQYLLKQADIDIKKILRERKLI